MKNYKQIIAYIKCLTLNAKRCLICMPVNRKKSPSPLHGHETMPWCKQFLPVVEEENEKWEKGWMRDGLWWGDTEREREQEV